MPKRSLALVAPEPVPSLDILWQWCRNGWQYRLAQGGAPAQPLLRDEARCVEQIHAEMNVIIPADFVDYFLLVSDLVRFAKDNGIPVGPGRGSSAASFVCWLLRITEVNPLLYPLMDFSRFIVPGRLDLPDIDIDFDDELRHLVREYAVRRYGADRVGNIGTLTKYKGKSAIKDVARVYRLPIGDMDRLKGMIVERSGGDSRADAALADTLDMFPEARAILDKYPDLQMAMRIEGNYRGESVHAAGLVITNTPIADVCALYTRNEKTAVSVNKYDAEYLGLMKVDLLGLSTMGMIRIALKEAGLTLEDLYRIPTDDPDTIAAFERNDVIGIFQFEGRATRLVGRDVKPTGFLELVDINGLSRPGPLFSGTTAEYIDVKHGRKQQVSLHPTIDAITRGTKGTIIYQEQILRALRDFGGLEAKKVHDIRKIISQKLGEAQFNASAEAFVEGAARLHGASRELAMEVWGRVVTSASYAFVYAHSLSYALIGYWCMWLKVHHPAAFYAAQLQKTDKEKWPRLIRDAETHGVTVRGVTPGLSQRTWSVADGQVIAGYLQLDGIGDAKARDILAYIERGGAVACAEDLLPIKGIGAKMVEKIKASMDSDDPFGLREVSNAIERVRVAIVDRSIPLRPPNVNSEDILEVHGGRQVWWLGRVKLKEYKDYVEDERARSGRDTEEIRKEMKRPDLPTSCVLHCYDDRNEDVYVRITRFNYPKWREVIESIELNHDVIWVAAKKSKGGFGASIYVDRLVAIDPYDDDVEDEDVVD